MAFNSDFIQASTMTSLVRSTIGGHILQNNSSDALELSGLSGVMELTQLNSEVVNATALISCSEFEPTISGQPFIFNSPLSLENNHINNVTAVNFSDNGTIWGLTSVSSGGLVPTTFTNDITVNGNIKNPQNIQMASNGAITNLSNITATENTFLQINSSIQFSGTGGGSISNITELNGIDDRISVLTDLDMNTTSLLQLGGLTINSGDPGVAGQVLSTTGTGLLWVDNGGGGSGADWSTYPAVQDVDLDGFNIDNVLETSSQSVKTDSILPITLNGDINLDSNLNFSSGGKISNITELNGNGDISVSNSLLMGGSDIGELGRLNLSIGGYGTAGQILTSGGSGANLTWTDAGGGSASDWSEYPATQNVDIASQNINNVGTINTTNTNATGITTQNLTSNTGTMTINDGTLNIKSSGQTTMQVESGGVFQIRGNNGQFFMYNTSDATATILASTAGNFFNSNNLASMSGWGTINCSSVEATNLKGTNISGQNLTSEIGTLNVNDVVLSVNQSNVPVFQMEPTGQFSMIGNNGEFRMYNDSSNNSTIFASTEGNFLNSTNGASMSGWANISCDFLNAGSIITPMRVERVYYVSPTGDDDTGNGSYLLPFRTIQKALTITEALSDSEYCYIKVMQGLYDGNINITRKVYIQGLGTSPFEASTGCYFSGTITIDLQTIGGGMFNNAVNLSGLLLASPIVYSSSYDGCLNIDNCYLFTNDDEEGYAIMFNPVSTDGRLRITNTIINSGGVDGVEPLINIFKASSLIMNNCLFTAKGLQNCLRFSSTATCDTINFCKFTNTNSSASVPALVEITSTNSASHAFSNCGFIYSSSTNKSGNANASGILCNSSSGNPTVINTYNQFFLTGTTSANYAVQDLKHATANQMLCFFYMSSAMVNNAFQIRGNNNQNKFQLVTVS